MFSVIEDLFNYNEGSATHSIKQ